MRQKLTKRFPPVHGLEADANLLPNPATTSQMQFSNNLGLEQLYYLYCLARADNMSEPKGPRVRKRVNLDHFL